MRLGRLRHRIQFQSLQSGQNEDTGALQAVWVNAFKAWCEFEYLSVREFMASNAGQVAISARIKTQFREDIDPTMRALYRGKIYNIHGVLPDNSSGREYITMPVSQGVNDGD